MTAPIDQPGAAAECFGIVCLARTGSSHLVELLDSHPEIRCYGEVLNLTHGSDEPGWLGGAETDNPCAHLDALLTGPADATTPTITGVKLPANSLREHPTVASWLADHPRLRMIRLRRINSLAILVSRRLLRATLVSQSTHGDYGDTRVEIEPLACVRALQRIESDDAGLDRLAAAHRRFEIAYEELADPARLADLQRFLGVAATTLHSRHRRVRTRSFAATVTNWDQLSSHLATTRFAAMLDE